MRRHLRTAARGRVRVRVRVRVNCGVTCAKWRADRALVSAARVAEPARAPSCRPAAHLANLAI